MIETMQISGWPGWWLLFSWDVDSIFMLASFYMDIIET